MVTSAVAWLGIQGSVRVAARHGTEQGEGEGAGRTTWVVWGGCARERGCAAARPTGYRWARCAALCCAVPEGHRQYPSIPARPPSTVRYLSHRAPAASPPQACLHISGHDRRGVTAGEAGGRRGAAAGGKHRLTGCKPPLYTGSKRGVAPPRGFHPFAPHPAGQVRVRPHPPAGSSVMQESPQAGSQKQAKDRPTPRAAAASSLFRGMTLRGAGVRCGARPSVHATSGRQHACVACGCLRTARRQARSGGAGGGPSSGGGGGGGDATTRAGTPLQSEIIAPSLPELRERPVSAPSAHLQRRCPLASHHMRRTYCTALA